MNRVLLALLALTVSGAHAAPAPDCGPDAPILAKSDTVTYTAKGVFPQPSKPTSLFFFIAVFGNPPSDPVTLCGYRFAPNRAKGQLTITSPSLRGLSRIFPKSASDVGVAYLDLDFRRAATGSRDLGAHVLFDPVGRRVSFERPRWATLSYTLGVTVDGGKVLPLYYNGTVTPVTIPPGARVVAVHVLPDADVRADWEEVRIDLKAPAVRFTQRAPFPK